MFSQIAVCLVLVAGAYGHAMGQGMMGMGMGNGMNSGMGNGMMGMNNGMGMGNGMNNGMDFSMLMQAMERMMSMGGNNRGNTMGRHSGGMNDGGMLTQMMHMMMLTNMMGGNNGGNQDNHDVSKEDLAKVEEMMKREFAMEVAQFVMVYQDYQEKMKAFKMAMEYLCLGVEAAYEHGRRSNMTENATMTEMVERLGERIESLGSRDEMLEALINAIQDDEKVFGEGFFKIATKVCKTGEEYMHAAEKMEKMEKMDNMDKMEEHMEKGDDKK